MYHMYILSATTTTSVSSDAKQLRCGPLTMRLHEFDHFFSLPAQAYLLSLLLSSTAWL